MKRDPLQEQLAALRAVREAPHAPESLALLRRALAGKSNLLVAQAAELVGELALRDLVPLLPPAFERFLDAPEKSDKRCAAKTAIAAALERLDFDEDDLFRRGIRHVQREPVWGGSEDTAVELRGICAVALARLDVPEVMSELATLLADRERGARAAAARAIGASRRDDGIPLLRFKVLIGDDDPLVLTECFTSLLELSPRAALALLRAKLDDHDEAVSDAAALALGQSRCDDAFAILRTWSESVLPARRRVALLAIGMLRTAVATDYLLATVADEGVEAAARALHALALQRADETLRARAWSAVRARDDRRVTAAFEESFAVAAAGDP